MVRHVNSVVKKIDALASFRFLQNNSNSVQIFPFIFSVGIRAVGAFLALTINVVLARMLGVHDYGRYIFLLSLAMVIGGLSVRGIDYVLTRELVGSIGMSSTERKDLAYWALSRLAIGGVLGAILYVIWISYFYYGISDLFASMHPVLSVISGVIIIVFSALVIIEAGAINGYSASLRSQGLPLVVLNSAILTGVGVLAAVANNRISVPQVLLIQAVSYMATFTVGLYWLNALKRCHKRNSGHVGIHALDNGKKVARWNAASRYFFLASVAALLVNKMDVVLLSVLANSEVVGIYAAGARLAQVALIIALAVNSMLSPKIAKAYQDCDQRKLKELLHGAFKLTIPIALLEIIVALLFSGGIVNLFGSAYASSAKSFFWVVVAYALWTALAPTYALFSMTGKERVVAKISWLILLVNFLAMTILAPLYGANGAAFAMTLGYGVADIALIFVLIVENKKKYALR